MYIETSNPRQDGDRAILQSKLFLPSGDSGERCLQFYYHMYGEHIGELKVLYSESDDIDKELWRETKNMGNQWHLKGVQLPPGSSPYRVSYRRQWRFSYLSSYSYFRHYFKHILAIICSYSVNPYFSCYPIPILLLCFSHSFNLI